MNTAIIPSDLEESYKKLMSTKTCTKKLAAFYRSPSFHDALILHRREFPRVHPLEYRGTLEVLFSFYKPGESVGINQLAKDAVTELDLRFKNRKLSKNDILHSFIQLLRDTGAITGDSKLIWSWLDQPTLKQRAKAKAKNIYTAYITQTEAEAAHKKELRNATALRKMQEVVLTNRAISEDIGHHLEVLRKMDERNRKSAMELNIPYSQVKAETMKKRNGEGIQLKSLIFPALLVSVIATTFILSGDDEVMADPDAQLGEVSQAYEGLSTGENIWREQYIALYKQYGNASHTTMEARMFALAAEYMIPQYRMEAIVKTINEDEVK